MDSRDIEYYLDNKLAIKDLIKFMTYQKGQFIEELKIINMIS